MIALRRPLAAACVALLAACGGNGTGPVAGSLKVNFTTPNNGHDAAVMLLLTAPAPPAGATGAAGLTVWGGGTPFSSTTTKLVVTGTLSTGTVFTLQVDDVNKVSQYTVSVQAVAADSAGGYLPRGVSGYSASITK
ncbi:MAG TPA: hypothetical protein VIV10_12400 [Gemmatimonadales bacterium]